MWRHMRRNQISSFAQNGPVHLNRPGGWGVSSVDCWQPRCAPSAVVMLDKPCSEVVWRVLATHCIRQLPFHFPSRASPWAITFQLESTNRKPQEIYFEAARHQWATQKMWKRIEDNPTHYCGMWATSSYRVCKEIWKTSQNYPSETDRSSRIDWW